MSSYSAEIKEMRVGVDRKRGQQEVLLSQVQRHKKILRNSKRDLRHIEEAQAIIQATAKVTQEELQYHISDLVSLALKAVFDEPYKLEVEFVMKRGRTEAELWFVRDGERVHPLSASGGGAVDVASFALRVALWALSYPRSRPVLILDEPFKFLSSGLQVRAGDMLKAISEKLNLQIIMVSHVPDLIESSDKVFEVRLKNGVSQVKII